MCICGRRWAILCALRPRTMSKYPASKKQWPLLVLLSLYTQSSKGHKLIWQHGMVHPTMHHSLAPCAIQAWWHITGKGIHQRMSMNLTWKLRSYYCKPLSWVWLRQLLSAVVDADTTNQCTIHMHRHTDNQEHAKAVSKQALIELNADKSCGICGIHVFACEVCPKALTHHHILFEM